MDSVRDISLYGTLFLGFVALVITIPVGDASSGVAPAERLAERVSSLGSAVSTEFGRYLGNYLTALLAVYAIYFGTGLTNVIAKHAPRLRRALATMTIFATSTLVPAVALILATSLISDASKLGDLIAAAPVLLVIFVLTIQLGNWSVGTIGEQIEAQKAELGRTERLLAAVPPSSSKPRWLVWIVNLLPSLAVAAAWAVIPRFGVLDQTVGTDSASMVSALGVFAGLTLTFTAFLGAAVTDSRFDYSMRSDPAVICFVYFAVLAIAAVLSALLFFANAPLSVATSAVWLFTLLSTFISSSKPGSVALNWTLRGLGLSTATLRLTRKLESTQKRLLDLKSLDPQEGITFMDRIAAAMRALTSPVKNREGQR